MPTDGTPLIVAVQVPPWQWSPFSWSPPRRTLTVSSDFDTNTGVYGPNPSVISGHFGVVVGPGPGAYGDKYVIKRVLQPGLHYIVVRTKAPVTSSVRLSIQ